MAAEDHVSVGSQILPDLQVSDEDLLLVVEKKEVCWDFVVDETLFVSPETSCSQLVQQYLPYVD
jgi:hypothetical protein